MRAVIVVACLFLVGLCQGGSRYCASIQDAAYFLDKYCATKNEFCSSVLTAPPPAATIYRYPTKRDFTTTSTISSTTTKYKYATVHTKTITAPVATLTQGKSTKTVQSCPRTSVCGAATISQIYQLQDACTCFLQDLITITAPTLTENTSYSYLGTATKTYNTTATTTVIPIKTITVPVYTTKQCITVPPPERDCGNEGFEYALHTILPRDKNGVSNLTKWDPAVYKTREPQVNGTFAYIGGFVEDDYTGDLLFYDMTASPQNQSVEHRGYFYAPQTGTYHFHFPAVSEVAYLWLDDLAVSGWNASNAILYAQDAPSNDAYAPRGAKIPVFLNRGTFHAFRIFYGIGSQRVPYFYFNIVLPNGLVVEGEYSSNGYFPDDNYYHHQYGDGVTVVGDYLVQYSCGPGAPMFPPFGSEP